MNKFIFLLLLFLSILSSCSSKKVNESNDKSIDVAVAIYRYDDSFISFMRRNIETFLKSDNVKFTMTDAENDQVKQYDQIEAAIQRNVDALAINLVDPLAANLVIEKVKPSNIPVIFFNKEPKKDDLLSYDKVWYVGTRSVESGDMQGNIVLNAWLSNPSLDKNKDGKLQYVLLKGEEGHPDAEGRTERVKAILEENGIVLEELEMNNANWDILQAQTLMDAWIKKHENNIEFIFSNNDAMALGALKSIQKEGYNIGDSNKFIPIVGVDAIPEVIEEIKKNAILGTVLQSPKDQAKAIVDMVMNVVNNKDVLEGTGYTLDEVKAVRVPYKAITIENINDAMDAYK